MQNLAHYAAALAPAQLKLPDNSMFSVDGQRIAQASTSMAASLLRPEPAVIIEISKVSETLPSVDDYARMYRKPSGVA